MEIIIKKQPLGRTRLDKLIIETLTLKKNAVRILLAKGLVSVNSVVVNAGDLIVDKFSVIIVDGQTLPSVTPLYIMLHKPKGVVSATIDSQHKTVIDLLPEAKYSPTDKASLHIVGRLDLNTTGLILLTNDSRWSEKLTLPESKMPKLYHVTLEKPLSDEYISAFANGMYFEFEDITTKPAQLTIVSPFVAEVTLVEGRYHQIKRMFGRFQNRVVALHRVSVGGVLLDESLAEGKSRALTEHEVRDVFLIDL